MAILVTGGAGYLGSHVCADLLEHGFDVVVADNYSSGPPGAVEAVRRLCDRRLIAEECDLRDPGDVDHVFGRHEIGAVVHCAAKRSVPESTHGPLEYFGTNVTGSVNLLRGMLAHDIDRLVLSSSCSVYGAGGTAPADEESPVAPVNPAGRTQLMAEQAAADACAANEDLAVTALRVTNQSGGHPSGALGQDGQDVPGSLMPSITKVAMGWDDRLPIFGTDYPTPDGTAVRDYVHVMDVAAAHRLALEHLGEQPGFQAVNLGTGHGVSVLELIAAFERECSVSVPYTLARRREGDVAVSAVDPGLAARAWGWRATRDLAQICRDAWRFRQRRPVGYGTWRAVAAPR